MPARSTWLGWFRLSGFARANGMFYAPQTSNPTYAGSIFGVGSEREVHDHVYRNDARFLDIGTYEYVTGSAKSRSVNRWGFMALKLDRRLPNMVLDARRSTNGMRSTSSPQT